MTTVNFIFNCVLLCVLIYMTIRQNRILKQTEKHSNDAMNFFLGTESIYQECVREITRQREKFLKMKIDYLAALEYAYKRYVNAKRKERKLTYKTNRKHNG